MKRRLATLLTAVLPLLLFAPNLAAQSQATSGIIRGTVTSQGGAPVAGAQVELRYREDAEILAGGVARMGSTIYDGSLRARLRRLQQQLTTESR